MMFVLAYTDAQMSAKGLDTEGLESIFVALSTVQTIREIGGGWTELRTHNHHVFYVPRPPRRIAEGGIAFGLS